MSQNFIACDRGQEMLMPPSLLEWVPGDHLVWTVLAAVEEIPLGGFYRAYRADGRGRPAYDPQMMVALLCYAYALGVRSSRAIERACREGVAFMVITGRRVPDHSTIAEFRRRHQEAIEELFTSVLGLCGEAGLVSVGMIAIDGTKVAANASRDQNKSYRRIVHEILEEAEQTDLLEDEELGDARGDELPEEMHTPEGRRAAIRAARERLERRETTPESPGEGRTDERSPAQQRDDGEPPVGESQHRLELEHPADSEPAGKTGLLEIDPVALSARGGGRDAWLVEARAQMTARRERERWAIPRSRGTRLLESVRRLEEDLAAIVEVNDAFEHHRATGRDSLGRKMSGRKVAPFTPPEQPDHKINTTDPDSRVMKTLGQPGRQGYNAQAAVNEHQIIVAAEVFCRSGDFGNFEPMVDATERELHAIGVTDTGTLLADPGYWHSRQIERTQERGWEVLMPPESRVTGNVRTGKKGGPYQEMRDKLATEDGNRLYKKRQATVEPVFGQMKYNRRIDRFLRRGHAAVRSEWRLASATHNLLKLHQHRIAIHGA